MTACTRVLCHLHFNPRSPCGERRLVLLLRDHATVFQSTLPVRGATVASVDSCAIASFQSTLPVRGATKRQIPKYAYPYISIHAPRAGSDLCM